MSSLMYKFMSIVCRSVVPLVLCVAGGCRPSDPSAMKQDPPRQESASQINGQVLAIKCADATSCFQDDISLQKAEASFKSIQTKVAECRKELAGTVSQSAPAKPLRQSHPEPQAQINKSMTLQEAMQDHLVELESQLDVETITPSHKCRLSTALDEICNEPNSDSCYYWAPASAFPDGELILKSLLHSAETGETVRGHMILDSAQSASGERHLARCNVRIISGIAGPPQDCATVAIIGPSESWLRGGHHTNMCNVMAYIRNSGAIGIRFKVLGASDVKAVADSILKTITDEIGLAAIETTHADEQGRVQFIDIKSQAGVRNSKILGEGWRETMDFDVDILKEQGFIAVDGTSHVMVERSAAVQLTDYHGADDAQRHLYSLELDSRVDTAIKAACSNYVKRDSLTILCK
jgi:hypothetical protein